MGCEQRLEAYLSGGIFVGSYIDDAELATQF
jgi:hypothetical protein